MPPMNDVGKNKEESEREFFVTLASMMDMQQLAQLIGGEEPAQDTLSATTYRKVKSMIDKGHPDWKAKVHAASAQLTVKNMLEKRLNIYKGLEAELKKSKYDPASIEAAEQLKVWPFAIQTRQRQSVLPTLMLSFPTFSHRRLERREGA